MRLVNISECAEVFQDLETGLSGFFRMKLNAEHMIALDCRGEGRSITRSMPRSRRSSGHRNEWVKYTKDGRAIPRNRTRAESICKRVPAHVG